MSQWDEQIEELIQQFADRGDLYSYAAVDALLGLATSWAAMSSEGAHLITLRSAVYLDIQATIQALKDFLGDMQAEGLA